MAIANELMNPAFLQGLKCIIFDCDGVLIDSYAANKRYYNQIKDQLGLPPLTDDEMAFVHTRTHLEAIKHIAPGEYFKKAWEAVERFDSTSLMPYIKRSEGLLEFLWWLRDAGFLLAINTSRGETIDAILEDKELEGFFHPIMTSAKVCQPKPHPEGVHKILGKLQLQPHEVAFIGDSHVDEKTARASGVRFWAYKDANLEAQVHIEDFWSIKAAMQRCYKGCGQVF